MNQASRILLCLCLLNAHRSQAATLFADLGENLKSFELFSVPDDRPLDATQAALELKTKEGRRILELYNQKLGLKTSSAEVEIVPSYFRPITQIDPPSPLYNASIIRVKKGREIVGIFRPFYVDTGCQNSCKPVVFHLQVATDASHKILGLLQDPTAPLLKIYHQPLSEADLKQATLLVTQTPPELVEFSRPTDLVDHQSPWPGQTISLLKPWVIEGAAYTSSRLMDAALTTVSYLTAQTDFGEEDFFKAQSLLARGLQVDGLANALKLASDLNRILKSTNESTEPRLDRRRALSLTAPLALYAARNKAREKDIQLIFSDQRFLGIWNRQVCIFLSALAETKPSEQQIKLYLKLVESDSKIQCNSDLSLSSLLLLSESPSEQLIASLKKKPVGLSRLVEEISRKPELAASLLKALETVDPKQKTLLQDHILVRFPYLPGLPKDTSPKPEVVAQHKNELARLLSPEPNKVAGLSLKMVNGKVGKPFNNSQKARAVVVFAPWCPHCKELLSTWVKRYSGDSDFWSAVRLVGTVTRGAQEITDFCKQIDLAKNHCSSISILEAGSKTDLRLRDPLGLAEVPQIILLSKTGEIMIKRLPEPLINNLRSFRNDLLTLQSLDK
jgi:thiol-disulfide isomerase/thioredoxin